MSSSRIESGDGEFAGLDREEGPVLQPAAEPPPSWLKRLLPRSLFGRSLLIIVMPLILLQLISAWIFYQRHWETVARRLSAGVAGEIAAMIDILPLLPRRADPKPFFHAASTHTDIEYAFLSGGRIDPDSDPAALGLTSIIAAPLIQAIKDKVKRPFRINMERDPHKVLVVIRLKDGVLQADVPVERLYSSTTYIFVLWMTGSSIVLFAIATLFMRNQVRSLRRLAAAAESFGKGVAVPNFKLEGATEIRQAGAAFLVMRDRIRRQISQRTEMLAGVSHDLRTPLTRMRLALAMLEDGPSVAELKADVAEMQKMIEGYLDFARGEGGEAAVETDLVALIDQIGADFRRHGVTADLSLLLPERLAALVRPNALKRCITNLVANACRHGHTVRVALTAGGSGIDILVDDDGPGIPRESRDAVFRPFFRLDPSRNQRTGGVGLGLTIARDVAHAHGGSLSLEDSPLGGLRARVHLPR